MKATKGLLPGQVAYSASPTLSPATALPLACSVANAAVPTIGIESATARHHLGPHPEDHKLVPQGTDIKPSSDAKEAGSNIKIKKVRKMLIIITQIS